MQALAELRDTLYNENGELIARRVELLEAFGRVPVEITDEDTAARVADYAKQLSTCEAAAEAARIARKDFFLNAGRTVDAFFASVIEPLADAHRLVVGRLADYQRRANIAGPVRGEYGAVASLKTRVVASDLDPKTIDLETLRPFFTPECLARAVRGFIKSGGRELRGATISETQSTVVR